MSHPNQRLRRPRTPTVPDFIRAELATEPLTLRQVAGFLLGLTLVVLLVVLFLSSGEVPA